MVMTQPRQYGTTLHIVEAVDEALDITLGPLGLSRDGKLDVGHVCSLDEGVAAVRALFGDDDDGAEAESGVGGQLDRVRLDRGRPGLVETVGLVSVVDNDEEEEGEGDEEREWTFSGGEHGGGGGGGGGGEGDGDGVRVRRK
jgi:hypothetical protein